jgi:hypothetical protein
MLSDDSATGGSKRLRRPTFPSTTVTVMGPKDAGGQ